MAFLLAGEPKVRLSALVVFSVASLDLLAGKVTLSRVYRFEGREDEGDAEKGDPGGDEEAARSAQIAEIQRRKEPRFDFPSGEHYRCQTITRFTFPFPPSRFHINFHIIHIHLHTFLYPHFNLHFIVIPISQA